MSTFITSEILSFIKCRFLQIFSLVTRTMTGFSVLSLLAFLKVIGKKRSLKSTMLSNSQQEHRQMEIPIHITAHHLKKNNVNKSKISVQQMSIFLNALRYQLFRSRGFHERKFEHCYFHPVYSYFSC